MTSTEGTTAMLDFLTSDFASATFEAQGPIAPGTEGFWKVWGAQVRTIRPGDLILTKDGDDFRWDLILDTFDAKASGLRRGFVSDAGKFTLGALAPVQVLRWGTHNTLA